MIDRMSEYRKNILSFTHSEWVANRFKIDIIVRKIRLEGRLGQRKR